MSDLIDFASPLLGQETMDLKRVLGLYNYWVVIFLMMTGFYIVIARSNLVKTVIGLNIFQTSVFLLYITMGKIKNGTTPILSAEEAKQMSHAGHHDAGHGTGHHVDKGVEHINEHAGDHLGAGEQTGEQTGEGAGEHVHEAMSGTGENATAEIGEVAEVTQRVFSNPLPSVLMLTAIVVGIATTALALALIVRIREDYGTIEEDEIMEIDLRS